MKDYRNYHNTNVNEKISHDGLLILEHSLNGFEASDVIINGTVTSKVLVYQKYDSDSETKKVIGRISDIERGNLLEIGSLKWLVVTLPEDNKIYRKSEVKLCNAHFPIQSNKTKVLLGNNPKTSEPIYEWQEGTPIDSPCIVETKHSGIVDGQLPLSEGEISITMKYQTAENLKENAEFPMYGKRYKINTIDLTKVIEGKGIMKIIAKEVK